MCYLLPCISEAVCDERPCPLQGTANFLGNITSILQSEIDLFSPTQTPSPTPSGIQRDPDMLYDEGVPYGRLGGGRHLLQSPVGPLELI